MYWGAEAQPGAGVGLTVEGPGQAALCRLDREFCLFPQGNGRPSEVFK